MRILWDECAWEEYLSWQAEDRKTLKRINSLLKDIQRNPFVGIDKPEPLREKLSGWWSRRIDETNPFSLYFGKKPLSLIERDYQSNEILRSF